MDELKTTSGGRERWSIRRLALGVRWRFFRLLGKNWPQTFQLLRYGTRNINTREHWDMAWTRHGKEGFRATGEMPALRERVLGAVPHAAKILDVGCGVGETMALLRDRKACTCLGVDIAPSAVSAVVAKGMQAKVATLPEIPYPDAAFDAVICTETLEHVTDARSVLREIRRVLKPDGLLVLSVPDGSVDREEAHVHRFKLEKLRTSLSKEFALEQIEQIPCESPTLFVVARRPREAAGHASQ